MLLDRADADADIRGDVALGLAVDPKRRNQDSELQLHGVAGKLAPAKRSMNLRAPALSAACHTIFLGNVRVTGMLAVAEDGIAEQEHILQHHADVSA